MAVHTYRQTRRGGAVKQPRKFNWHIIAISVGAMAGLFIVVNIAMLAIYNKKVLPRHRLATVQIGGIPFDQLDGRVSVENILPATITLSTPAKQRKLAPKDAGITIDWPATRNTLEKTRTWLPIFSLVRTQTVSVTLSVDNAQFSEAAKTLETDLASAALPERIVFKDSSFVIAAPEPGYNVNVVQLRSDLLAAVEQGKISLDVPTAVTHSNEPIGKLTGELARLQKRLDSQITLVAGGQKKQLTRAEIGRFYEQSGQTMQWSEAQTNVIIGQVANSLGIAPVNQSEAVRAATYALDKSQPVTFMLAPQGTKVYRYCTAVKGVDSAALPEYRQKLAAVYGDPRGWNQAGIAFVYAESGCSYTAWLSAPQYMTSFGSICDNYYSCRVGANVVVNYDRWMGATDPWNQAGGSLEDYRVMVINHESGHWLGFDHRMCPGAGQPAPVMQQQSISLQGCTFNPWPTALEIATLRG